MASRQSYNVNTQIKLLDIHNQFSGGLKTVDTDDALKDFFLRQAENVSISEFGFLEKRYGLVTKREIVLTTNGTNEQTIEVDKLLQMHYKYKTPTGDIEFIAYNGNLYIKEQNETEFTKVSEFVKNTTDFPTSYFPSDAVLGGVIDYANGEFQNTRSVQAVRVEDDLYIFTGSYPLVYRGSGKEVELMPTFVPNFNEIEDYTQGVNILIDEPDRAYFYTTDVNYPMAPSSSSTEFTPATIDDFPVITPNTQKSYYAPLIPYLIDSGSEQITFEFSGEFPLYSEAFDTFSGYTIGSGTYTEELFDPKKRYLVSETDPDGVACYFEESYLQYNDTNSTSYFKCTITNGPSEFHIIEPKLYWKYAGADSSSYAAVPDSKIFKIHLLSNATDSTDFFYSGEIYDFGYTGGSKYQFESIGSSAGTLSANPKIIINGFETGFYDFLFQIEYKRVYAKDGISLVEQSLSTYTVEQPNVQVVSQKPNFNDFYEDKAVWGCNNAMVHYSKLLAWGSELEPEAIFISDPTERNWFPANGVQEFDTERNEPIVSVTPFMQVLVVQSESRTWGLKGTQIFLSDSTAADLYQVFDISPVYGTIAPKSVRPVRNRLYFLSREGIVELNSLYAVDFRYNVNELDRNIKNIVPRDTNAVGIQHDYQYWINFPEEGKTLRYYIDKKAWVMDTYGQDEIVEDNQFDFNGVHKYYSEDGVLTFITNPTNLDVENVGIFEIQVDKSVPSDLGYAIKTQFETSYLNQGYPFHPKKYLETKLDFTIQNEYNLSKDLIPITNVTNADTYAQGDAEVIRNHYYQLTVPVTFDNPQDQFGIPNVQISFDDGTFENVPNYTQQIITEDGLEVDYILRFSIPYRVFEKATLKVLDDNALPPSIYLENAVLKDITFDYALSLKTWMISEQGTLNLDNLESYDADQAAIEINLGTVFGAGETWVFDESAFDDQIVAVKTVKLSGRGYNYKLYLTDRTKSKWTLESLGVTFKMKRARSR